MIDPTTQLPALAIPALAVVTLGLARTGGDLAVLGVRRRHRPRAGDGGLVRRRRAAGPGRARRAGRGGPRARRARVRPDLRPGDRRHGRQRPRPAVPPRRRRAVQRAATAGCCSSRRSLVAAMLFVGADRPPVRPGPARPRRATCRRRRPTGCAGRSAPRPRSASSSSALSGWLLSLDAAQARRRTTSATSRVDEPIVDTDSRASTSTCQLQPGQVGLNAAAGRRATRRQGLADLVVDVHARRRLEPRRRSCSRSR